MSLKNLKLSAASPLKVADPTQRRRNTLLAYLGEQKSLAAAEAEGRTFVASRIVRRRTETGEIVHAEAPRHIRRGWFTGADGKLHFHLRYGAKPLELGKGVNAVVVPTREELPVILDALIAAVHEGELDEAVSTAAAQRRANFARRNIKQA